MDKLRITNLIKRQADYAMNAAGADLVPEQQEWAGDCLEIVLAYVEEHPEDFSAEEISTYKEQLQKIREFEQWLKDMKKERSF